MIKQEDSFIHQLESRQYTKEEVLKVVIAHSNNISEAIKLGEIFNETREEVSKRMFNDLKD